MQQQWGHFINRVLNIFKWYWEDKSACPLSPSSITLCKQKFYGKEYFIGCHKRAASSMDKYT